MFLTKLQGLSVQEKWKTDFQDSGHGGHLGFPIGTTLAIFDLQITPMRPTMFKFNRPFASGEESKNRFSRWRPRKDFSYFWSKKSPRCFLPGFESNGFSVQKKKRKIYFQDGGHGGHLRFPVERILATFNLQVIPMLPTKFRVNWSRGGGVDFLSKLLTPHDGRRTTDIDRSQ